MGSNSWKGGLGYVLLRLYTGTSALPRFRAPLPSTWFRLQRRFHTLRHGCHLGPFSLAVLLDGTEGAGDSKGGFKVHGSCVPAKHQTVDLWEVDMKCPFPDFRPRCCGGSSQCLSTSPSSTGQLMLPVRIQGAAQLGLLPRVRDCVKEPSTGRPI